MEAMMLKISPGKETSEVTIIKDYRNFQNMISRLNGEPPPPCCYCTSKQIWHCSLAGEECSIYRLYCSEYSTC